MVGTRTVAILGAVICVWGFALPAWGGQVDVGFDRSLYYAGPGDEFDVWARVDQAGLTNGLMSMGVTLTFDPSKAEILSIGIVGDLDDDGSGALGHTHIGSGLGRAAGFHAGAGTFNGSDLAMFHLRNLANVGSYDLNLTLYDTTPSFANFIDGDTSQDIDSSIAFGSATVTVPEPATMSLLALGGLALLYRKRR